LRSNESEMSSITITSGEILRFAAVLLRVSGIMIFAPFFGNRSIPVHIRIILSLVCSFVLASSIPSAAFPAELELSNLAFLVFTEVLVGIILGLIASFVFAGFQFAGQMISFQLGFSLIRMIDPQTQVESSVFSFLQNYIGLLFFLMIDGHHWFLTAINDSFGFLPVGGIHLDGSIAEYIVQLSAQILVVGLKIAGPVIAVGILVDIVIGIIGRAAPQIHILIVGMPLKVLVGFGCLSLSFYFQPRLFEEVFSSLYESMFSILQAIA
jgi:flagellar biosynthetic protein FliR